jgi:hypothetical protein
MQTFWYAEIKKILNVLIASSLLRLILKMRDERVQKTGRQECKKYAQLIRARKIREIILIQSVRGERWVKFYNFLDAKKS